MINLKIIFFILGILISVLGIAMLIPLVTNLIYQENIYIFSSSLLISSFFGFSLILAFRNNNKKISIKDTIVITVLSFPVLCFFSSLPFYFDQNVVDFSEAFLRLPLG